MDDMAFSNEPEELEITPEQQEVVRTLAVSADGDLRHAIRHLLSTANGKSIGMLLAREKLSAVVMPTPVVQKDPKIEAGFIGKGRNMTYVPAVHDRGHKYHHRKGAKRDLRRRLKS